MIELQVLPAGAPPNAALAPADDHRGAQLRRDVPAEVRDRVDVLAVLDDRGHERLTEESTDPLSVDRPDTGDLARLTGECVTTLQGLVVEHDVGRATARGGTRRLPQHELSECIGRIRVHRCTGSATFCAAEQSASMRLDPGLHPSTDLRREPKVRFEHPVDVGPRVERASRVLTHHALHRIFHTGPRRDARVSQWHQTLGRDLDQLAFRRRVVDRRRRDQLRGAGRQPARSHRRLRRRK